MSARIAVGFLAFALLACVEEAVSTGGSGGAGSGGQSAGSGGNKTGSGGTFSSGNPGGQGGSGTAGTGTAGAGVAGSEQAGGSGTSNNCGLTTNNASCDACMDTSCCAQETACASNAQCLPLLQCASKCSSQSCANDCGAQFSSAVDVYNDLIGCFSGTCGSACGSSSGQGGSSSGQGGSSPGQGGSSSGQGGSNTGTGGSPATDDDGQYCVDKINQYRATLGLPPLARWYDAEQCSNGEALQDSQSGKAHGAFGQCGEFAQNECPGWPGPIKSMLDGCLQMMWDEGPGADFQAHGHYINMSSTKYTRVGCGFAATPQGSYWSVQNFQ